MINRSFIISFLILLVAILVVQLLVNPKDVVVVEKRLDHFPLQLDGYIGRKISMPLSVVKELDADVYIYRDYRAKNKNHITLYIGYYGTAKGGRTGHNPNVCYPSSGFAIVDERKIGIPVKFKAKNDYVVVTRLIVEKSGVKQVVYYWYQSSANSILPDGIAQNIHRFKSKLFYNRNDGAFVRVSSIVRQNITIEEKDLRAFVIMIIPHIEAYWPVEQEVDDH